MGCDSGMFHLTDGLHTGHQEEFRECYDTIGLARMLPLADIIGAPYVRRAGAQDPSGRPAMDSRSQTYIPLSDLAEGLEPSGPPDT